MLNKLPYRVTPRRKIEKKTNSQSPAKAPSYTTGAVGLSISPLPVNIRNNRKGKYTNKEGNTCTNDKGKQINKQTRSSMCRGTDAGGSTVVAQSAESTMQCVRVCRRASEMFREVWSSVCKVIL